MKPSLRRALKESLSKDHSCYVLITCTKPHGPDGSMEVEMEYDGDPLVVACLLQGAQDQLDEEILEGTFLD